MDEQVRPWKWVGKACFKALSQHPEEKSAEIHEITHSESLINRQKFE
jgi:hypothetical protein